MSSPKRRKRPPRRPDQPEKAPPCHYGHPTDPFRVCTLDDRHESDHAGFWAGRPHYWSTQNDQ